MYHALFKRDEMTRRRSRRMFLRPFVQPGVIVFDVGANHGRYSEAFLELGARVVAVEPNPALAALIELRYGDSRLHVVAAALGAKEGVGQLLLGPGDGDSTLAADYAKLVGGYRGEISVPVRTLDGLIADFGEPAFVKIDVEGYDSVVLSGLTRPVRSLSFEFHGATPEITLACLQEVGRIGDYVFNAIVGEATKWLLPTFGAQNQVIERIRRLAESDRRLYGDVYAVRRDNAAAVAEAAHEGAAMFYEKS